MNVDILYWLWVVGIILTVLGFRILVKQILRLERDIGLLEAKNTNRKKEIDQIMDYIEQEKK